MIDDVEYTGMWWLPANPEIRFPGILRFTQSDGATLELNGSFTEDTKDELFSPAIINGVSGAGTDITLYDCLGTYLSLHAGGESESKFYAHQVFVGVHFHKPEDIVLKSVRVEFSRLDAWLQISGFHFQRQGEELLIRYKRPDSFQTLLGDDLIVSIDFASTYSPFMLTQAELKQRASVGFYSTQERSFEEFRHLLNHFRNLLTLANMEPVHPTSIVGIADIDSYNRKIGNNILHPEIKIMYQLPRTVNKPSKGYWTEPFISFKVLSENLRLYIGNWFEKEKLLEPLHQLYFSVVYNPDTYLEQRFLSLVQALEAYHRRTTPNYEVPEEQHEERLKRILSAVPTEDKRWLTDELRYSNEPTLRRRLKELLENHMPAVSLLIKKRGDFINRVYTTRNYLVHYDPTLRNKAARGQELQSITTYLKALAEACLLHETGFTSENTVRIIHDYYTRYKY